MGTLVTVASSVAAVDHLRVSGAAGFLIVVPVAHVHEELTDLVIVGEKFSAALGWLSGVVEGGSVCFRDAQRAEVVAAGGCHDCLARVGLTDLAEGGLGRHGDWSRCLDSWLCCWVEVGERLCRVLA